MKSGDEDELFHQAVADVRPLNHNLAVPTRAPKHSIAAKTASVETVAEFAEFGEELRYLRPGIQTSLLQKLRRGQFPIEAVLDLHGLTAAEASVKLKQFLEQSRTVRRHAVRIVHGKGYGSTGRQPVLKTKVHQFLPQFSFVLAFCFRHIRETEEPEPSTCC